MFQFPQSWSSFTFQKHSPAVFYSWAFCSHKFVKFCLTVEDAYLSLSLSLTFPFMLSRSLFCHLSFTLSLSLSLSWPPQFVFIILKCRSPVAVYLELHPCIPIPLGTKLQEEIFQESFIWAQNKPSWRKICWSNHSARFKICRVWLKLLKFWELQLELVLLSLKFEDKFLWSKDCNKDNTAILGIVNCKE